MIDDSELAFRLTHRTRQLVDIASVSRDEQRLLDFIKSELPVSGRSIPELPGEFPVLHDDDSVYVVTQPRRPGRPLVMLAGHTDTVPIAGNVPSRLEGNVIWGRGTSDMKGGLAVMLELADWLSAEQPDSAFDVGFCFFGREELPASENPLLPALQTNSALREVDLAILMEPTSNGLQAGCQGNLNVDVTFTGTAAHSALTWLGTNAVHEMVNALAEVASAEPNDVVIDGLTFREVASVTGIEGGGIARNITPDHAVVRLNIRYAPNRNPKDVAASWVDRFTGEHSTATVFSLALPAPVALGHPLTKSLIAAGAGTPYPTNVWTNAADFAACGISAVNFGPGDPAFAHRDDEQIDADAIVKSFTVLRDFVLGIKR